MHTTTASGTIVKGIRTAFIVGGALAVIVGLLILIWPAKTAMVVAGIIAVYAIIAGLVYAAIGILSKTAGGWSRIGHIVLGLLFVLAGIVAFSNLGLAAATLATFLGALVGIMWIIEGVVALSTLPAGRTRLWTLAFAILSLVAGIFILFAPLWGAVVLWWMMGISLVALGLIQIVRAFSLRVR
ncbi:MULTISPECIES: HdeD family acid-resistance protein [unclassified Microbacterium]|uniref:HdeD family acid-resistance protein n=1 Tax=unclassified Microbacterium TaxID=2609290 RepID=UPI003868B27D